MNTPALRDYRLLPLADLVPYARNARTHSREQVDQIVASIREFGWTNPELVDAAGGIVAGHGRVLAAQRMGMAEVPCLVLDDLTDAQRRAYVLADNRLALNAGWDEQMLARELAALDESDFELSLTGFAQAEIDRLTAAAPPSQARLRAAEAAEAAEAAVASEPTADAAEFERQMHAPAPRAALPIVPLYAESHAAIVIICDNAVDEAWLRQRLNLDAPQASYKDVKPMRPDITTVAAVRRAFAE